MSGSYGKKIHPELCQDDLDMISGWNLQFLKVARNDGYPFLLCGPIWNPCPPAYHLHGFWVGLEQPKEKPQGTAANSWRATSNRWNSYDIAVAAPLGGRKPHRTRKALCEFTVHLSKGRCFKVACVFQKRYIERNWIAFYFKLFPPRDLRAFSSSWP